jgi:hypothetical protein
MQPELIAADAHAPLSRTFIVFSTLQTQPQNKRVLFRPHSAPARSTDLGNIFGGFTLNLKRFAADLCIAGLEFLIKTIGRWEVHTLC